MTLIQMRPIVLVSLALGLLLHAPLAARQGSLPTGREIVARHVAAVGGEAAYAAVRSIRARGRFEIASQRITGDAELLSARPAMLRYRVTVPGLGQIESGYNGTLGWALSPVTGPELLTGRQLSEAADDAWFDSTLHAASRVREITPLARVEFDGRPAYKVKVVSVAGNEQTEYFDVETGLQIGWEATRAVPQGLVPTVNVLRDYRKFGDLLQATTFVQRALGFEQVLTLTSYEYNVVAPGAFEPPAEVAALVGR